MFSDELKAYTMPVHQGLEKKLILQIKQISTIADYVELLELMYGFYAPLQQQTSAFLPGRHAENILDDISFFTGVQEIPRETEQTPDINSYPEALGACYVTEGSTLGGVIIAGMISKKLNIPGDKGFSFFNAYGEKTKENWEQFRKLLNEEFTTEEKELIKKSAINTFSTFNEWIEQHEPATDQ